MSRSTLSTKHVEEEFSAENPEMGERRRFATVHISPDPVNGEDGVPEEEKVTGKVANFLGAVYTFSGAVENHAGMQELGARREALTYKELLKMKAHLEQSGATVKLVDLSKESGTGVDGWVLHAKGGLGALKVSADSLHAELNALGEAGVDKKANMRGRVVNKRARWNFTCTEGPHQPADYEKKMGTVYAFDELPVLEQVRAALDQMGTALDMVKIKKLLAEANVYFDLNTGIGFHGDTERNIVIGVNMGKSRVLQFQAFERTLPIGKRVTLTLDHGDVYAMCGGKDGKGGANGSNWKKSVVGTYRHRAGYPQWLAKEERANQSKWEKRKDTVSLAAHDKKRKLKELQDSKDEAARAKKSTKHEQ